jgi:aminopeptidase N
MVSGILSLVMFILAHAATAEAGEEHQFPIYDLSVSFELKTGLLRGIASIVLPGDKDAIIFAGDLRIESLRLNGKPLDYRIKDGTFSVAGKGVLEIQYEGTFTRESGKAVDRENPGVVSVGMVSENGASLTGNWYPAIQGLSYYKLTAFVPGNFIAISEADEITSTETATGTEYIFHFPHPLNGINFAAGEYEVVCDKLNDIDIYIYFIAEDRSLASEYMEYTKKYLRMYGQLLVPYPYKRFSVVENILPTGYSMPTFTLLGRDVVRLPFITSTSLGHEITHQWFGNYVYADMTGGNWLEAITTYLSNHLYEEQQGMGWEYRKKILTDYQSYVTPEKDFPLRDFVQRTDFASMSIGYGKGAMLFHMLKDLVGEETFYRSLRGLIENNKFRNASWTDIERSFERESGKDLQWFFDQWLNRKGVPSFAMTDHNLLVLNGVSTVSFVLIQKGEPYKLALPLRIFTDNGETRETLMLEKEKHFFEVRINEKPLEAVYDGNYDIMRRRFDDEFPPVISRLLGDKKKVIIFAEKDRGKYANLIKFLKDEGFTPTEYHELKDETIRTSSLLVLGFESPVLKRLFGEVKKPGDGFMLEVRSNPLNASKVVAYANADAQLAIL